MIDVVNGVVIGEMETRDFYRFYSEKDGRLLWEAGFQENDETAIKTFWDKFSCDLCLVKQYKKEGVEMRVWRP